LRPSDWKRSFLSCATQSRPIAWSNNIFKAVAEHAAGADPFDDQTVVAIRVKDGVECGWFGQNASEAPGQS